MRSLAMNEYDLNASLRKSIARRDAYDKGERIVMWICAVIVVAVSAWKLYHLVAVKLAGIL
jgi:hypothetical protein